MLSLWSQDKDFVNITQILPDGPTTKDWCLRWCLHFFLLLFMSPLLLWLLLFWLTQWVRVLPFASALTSAKIFFVDLNWKRFLVAARFEPSTFLSNTWRIRPQDHACCIPISIQMSLLLSLLHYALVFLLSFCLQCICPSICLSIRNIRLEGWRSL